MLKLTQISKIFYSSFNLRTRKLHRCRENGPFTLRNNLMVLFCNFFPNLKTVTDMSCFPTTV